MSYKKEYNMGDRVSIRGKKYLLARISRTRATLISLKDGNRWRDNKIILPPEIATISGKKLVKYIQEG